METDLTAAAAADRPTPAVEELVEESASTRPEPIDLTTLHKIGIRTVLTLAGRPFPGPGARERAIREQLGISPARYYQLLNALLDNVEALAIDPITVNGLRRLRDRRRAARESGRPGNGEAPSSFAP